MANKGLFRSAAARAVAPNADTRNEAGGLAYSMEGKHALAQFAMTGCLSNTFYATSGEQLDTVVRLCKQAPIDFVAKTAVHAREDGYMKDMPALLAAFVYANDKGGKLLPTILPRVIDNAKMLSNFAQIARSGVLGRKGLAASSVRRAITALLDSKSDDQIFRWSVGNANPSLADVIRLVRPEPKTASRRALYGYISGRNPKEFDRSKPARSGNYGYNEADLPDLVKAFEAFKRDPANPVVPDVPFQLLTALPLGKPEWTRIALQSSWQTVRMNLNTFQRHGVLEDKQVVRKIAEKLMDAEQIKRSRVMPHQLLAAYRFADHTIPAEIREALQTALDIATANVPTVEGNVVICVDVSGSMRSPVTGQKDGEKTGKGKRAGGVGGSASQVQCIDAAALIAACVLRQNKAAEVLIFSDRVHQGSTFNPRDSVITNADKISREPSGGTNCSAVLAYINHYKKPVDLVVMLSDYESWMDGSGRQIRSSQGGTTAMMEQWNIIRARNPKARLACIDMQPNETTQVINREDIVNFGGFSPQVFDVLAAASKDRISPTFWTDRISQVTL